MFIQDRSVIFFFKFRVNTLSIFIMSVTFSGSQLLFFSAVGSCLLLKVWTNPVHESA